MIAASSIPLISSRKSVQSARGETAAILRDLTKAPELAGRASELNALADSLEAGGEAESGWRGANLVESFQPNQVLHRPAEPAGVRLLGTMATIVVFFPIAWTWWGLRVALAEYRGVMAADSSETRSFLQLWTQGFDGAIPGHLALPEVALGSVLLIAVSILLVLIERMNHSRSAIRQERHSERLGSQLSGVILLAEQTLRMGTMQTNEDRVALLEDAAQAIQDAHGLIAVLTKDLENVSAKLKVDVSDASTALQTSATVAAQELKEAGSSASSAFKDAASDGSELIRTATTSALSGLTSSVQLIENAASSQTAAADSATGASNELAKAAGAIGSNVTAMNASIAGLKTGLESAIGPVVTSLDNRALELNGHTSSLEEALSSHTAVLQHQISELTQIRAELGRLQSATVTSASLAPAPVVRS